MSREKSNVMDFKKLLALVSLCICSFVVQAQNHHREIIFTFNSYRSLLENKEYSKAMDHYLDSFLIYIPKEELIKGFVEELDNNSSVEASVSDSKILFLSELVTGNDHRYAYIRYSAVHEYRFTDSASDEFKEKIKTMFADRYGNDYSFSEKKQRITFLRYGELIATDKTGEWKFIVYKEKLNNYMKIWMPESTFKELLKKMTGKNMLK